MKHVLVAYFSVSGVTAKLAKTFADVTRADLFEIRPAQAYTAADLNWKDRQSRSSLEMMNPNARPALAERVENMDQYDAVILAFPIWWGEAPRVVETFVEAHDLSGKTVLSICTSGGSGYGKSGKILASLTDDRVHWMEGDRFSANAAPEEIDAWLSKKGWKIDRKA